MEVTIEPHIGESLRRNPDGSRKQVRLNQYVVRVDGVQAGYLGFELGSKFLAITQFSPIELKEIESQLANLVGQSEVASVMPPEVPDEIMNPKESEDFGVDDFDA